MCLPQAKVVVDKFHLIRHINRALDKVRTRLQGGNRRGKKRELFKSRYTLLKGVERLVDWGKARLNELFYRYTGAWVLKESFRDWYRGTNRSRVIIFTLIDVEALITSYCFCVERCGRIKVKMQHRAD
jgi:hypothetical protein